MNTFTSTRKFGIEIEGCGISKVAAYNAINATGIDVQNEHLNHTTRNYWKVVEDGSVAGGWEVVSPVLSGVEGLEAVRKVAQALVSAGAKVDGRCGLHVHVDAGDLTGNAIIQAVKRYSENETEIDKLVPAARRNSRWCRGMTEVANSLTSLTGSTAHSVCSRWQGDRYRKLNLASFLRHGTLEFRQHSGTVDATKMVNWIVFCVTFIEDSKTTAPVVVPVAPTASTRVNAIGTKFAKMLAIFSNTGRYNTVTVDYLAQELDLSPTSVPSYVSQFRDRYPTVTIKARHGGRYYCQNPYEAMDVQRNGGTQVAPQTRSVAPSVASVGIYDNLPVEVRSYFHERSMDLGG
jgi:hypothetical protein